MGWPRLCSRNSNKSQHLGSCIGRGKYSKLERTISSDADDRPGATAIPLSSLVGRLRQEPL